MNVNLAEVVAECPLHPSGRWHMHCYNWEEFVVFGSFRNVELGFIRITRVQNLLDMPSDEFYFDQTQGSPIMKPYVRYQQTHEDFRKQGVSGRIIALANEFYRETLGTKIYSDIALNARATRVWRKLEEQGLAQLRPYTAPTGDVCLRWKML